MLKTLAASAEKTVELQLQEFHKALGLKGPCELLLQGVEDQDEGQVGK
jgi:hypothetical protein